MSYLSEQDADSPLSRWQFEETTGSTIDDDKTVTRDGTITGTVTLNQPAVFNDGGLGATFDGTSGFVTMGAMNGLLGIGTVEAIVQFNSIPATQVAVFTHQFSGSILPMVIGFNLDSSHTSQLQVGYFTGSVWQTATFAAVTTGTPYHIVGKYDGTTVKMRVNGVQVDSTPVTTVRPGAGTVLANAYIGKNWNSNIFLSGKVYDVAIYAAALSDARIDAHFATLGNGFADNFASAKPVFLASGLNNIDTSTWTLEGSEPGTMFQSGWASFTPPATDVYEFSTVGSNYDTMLALYTGTALNNLVLTIGDDNSGGSGASLFRVSLTSGTQYYLQLGAVSNGAGGLASFSLRAVAAARISGDYIEVLDNGTAIARVSASYIAALTQNQTTTIARHSLAYVEVLTPTATVFVGWGLDR
jgi:hypothetical protein